MAEQYPARQPFFAYRFCRLLTKCCAAQEIHPEACWMLAVIAMQEDAKRYTAPVTYYNEQLMPLCGFGSVDRLIRARTKAIGAGWLHYEPGGKSIAGKYWVTIPEHYGTLPDGPVDEGSFTRETREETREEMISTRETRDYSRVQAEGNREYKPRETANLPTLSLTPAPPPPPIKPEEAEEEAGKNGWGRVAQMLASRHIRNFRVRPADPRTTPAQVAAVIETWDGLQTNMVAEDAAAVLVNRIKQHTPEINPKHGWGRRKQSDG